MSVRKYTAQLAISVLLASSSSAMAGEIVINQVKKKFDQKKVSISKGDSIKFVNKDKVAHNIYSKSAGRKFDSGVQKPGDTSVFTFSKDGTFKVWCAIHPKMKLKLKVQ